ncbi:fumarylacetoacetate hydrolase family protein [Pleionea sediminis]|uniref:fumarylacetoacetate hydrolase family protein n=1 Tax=Pleionea sediminis TaxID=2569479 RepID=UPI0011851C00|nr:fumarylacetoacetate hydrolase family protein [Pleionea sediminis]
MSSYQFHGSLNKLSGLKPGKVVCVGRNYAAHAKELGNEVPSSPVLFMKPATALVNWNDQVVIPTDRGECHHELELAVLIGQTLSSAYETEVEQSIVGISLALDLTLRDLQSDLKAKGHPWEMAKAFDGSCPVAQWMPLNSIEELSDCLLELSVNDSLRQSTLTSSMIWPVVPLIQYISKYFRLEPGDIILTGTPAGVAALHPGDHLQAKLANRLTIDSEVTARD